MINISQLVDNQLPAFFRQEYPLFVEFFKQYYQYTEVDGSSYSLLKKIQSYQSSDFYKDGIILETKLASSITKASTEVQLSNDSDGNDVPIYKRFPSEGLLLLSSPTSNEIIQYKSIDANGLVSIIYRGSAGTVKLGDLLTDSVSYESTDVSDFDSSNTVVTNITHLFLASLFKNLKTQYFSGIPVERLNENISVPTILKYIKDFYTSKGTSPAVEFLFRSAFNDEKVLVRYPNEQLIKLSTSTWSVDTVIQTNLIKFTNGVSVEDLSGLVLKQITYDYDKSISQATASIERAVPVKVGTDIVYKIFINQESKIGSFLPTNQTISRTNFSIISKTLVVDSTIGFPEINGIFYVEDVVDATGNPIPFTYTDKTNTEFYGIETDAVGFTDVQKNKRVYSSNVLYVVENIGDDPLQSNYAEFRPTGLVSSIDIINSGQYLKEDDVIEFGSSGKKPSIPLHTSWIQNVPGPNSNVSLVNVSGMMDSTYLIGDYRVTKGVNGVFENDDSVYVSSNGFPFVAGIIGNIQGGPYAALQPASQRHLKKIPKIQKFGESKTPLVENNTIAIAVDGVPISSPLGSSELTSNREVVSQGEVTSIIVTNPGNGYINPPKVTISGVGGATAVANVQNGKVTSIDIINAGQGYRTKPNITISSGSGAVLSASFAANDKIGSIDSLSIDSSGSNYTQTPDIVIIDESGRGRGSKFVVDSIDPTTGAILSVRKVSGGYDYDKDKTKIYVVSSASGASATSTIRQWHRDNYKHYVNFADGANGYPFPGRIPEYNDAYYYVGNPLGIRITLGDNVSPNGIEQTSNLTHSPIVAWSYDGVPIYGPVGYSDPLNSGSAVKRLETSYYVKSNRGTYGPTSIEYSMGTFIEDYEYKSEGDPLHKDLDAYNGRFCVTPEFPEGRYCYFLTIHSSSDPNQSDRQDAKPRYPYVIGPSYRFDPDTFNFTTQSILKNLPLDTIRIRDANNNTPQFGSRVTANITKVSRGNIDDIFIENPGTNFVSDEVTYVPKFLSGDRLFVDDTNTQGSGFSAKVTSIKPKNESGSSVNVSSITSTVISGILDSREQKLVIESPNFDPLTSEFQYNKIFENDIIQDTTRNQFILQTAISSGEEDQSILFKTENTSNLSIGDTVEIKDEVVYINSLPVNSQKYAYLTVNTIYSTPPVEPATDAGFYYQYYRGRELFDEIYIDSGDDSLKIGRILQIDYENSVLKVEMYINPNTSTYYTIPTSGTGISNAPQSESRYSQNVFSVENIKEISVIRGYDGSPISRHSANVIAKTQIPTAKVTSYSARLYVTSTDPTLFTVGTYIKGAVSDTTARIIKIDQLSSSTAYFYIDDIKSGADASDVPRFGVYNAGLFGPETINEIGTANTTILLSDIDEDDTILSVVNSSIFPINRYISIGGELMRIVSRRSKQLIVARAQGGTTAETHSESSVITLSNSSATFSSDQYQIFVDLQNSQRFTDSSEFIDANGSTIDVLEATTENVPSWIGRITLKANNIDKFNVGDVLDINDELLRIDAKQSNILYVTRGFSNTTAQEHEHEAPVENTSSYIATLNTSTSHGMLDADFVEVFGDPASSTTQTNVQVRYISGNFRFSSIHTNNTFVSNPELVFVYGHDYFFDVSDASNTNTILGFFNDQNYINEISVDRVGTPGTAGAGIVLKKTDRTSSNVYYNNSNNINPYVTGKIRLIEDPYNTSAIPIFDVTSTSFKYIIRTKPEGNARGTKFFGAVTNRLPGEIARVQITNTGSGYESLPQIRGIYLKEDDAFDGNIITDDDGKIIRVDVNFGGSRYILPTVYVIGSGSGAVLTADVSVDGSVSGINIIDGGYGYTSDTNLILVEEDSRVFKALAISSSIGRMLSYEIIDPGTNFSYNYTMVPETSVPTSIQLRNVNGLYMKNETVYQGSVNNPSTTGRVISYDENTQILRIESVRGAFIEDSTITGYTSSTTSIPLKVYQSEISSNVSASTTVNGIFSDELGKLNTASQKIQDSFFYQDFSYVIRSQIPVSDWREIIKDSTHPAGFVVFGEVIIDSSASVAMLPTLGATSCPSNSQTSSYKFDTRTDIGEDGYIFIRNGQSFKVGDAIKLSNLSDVEVEWQAISITGEVIRGRLVNNKIYYVLQAIDDPDGKYIKLGLYHPDDKYADIDHNRENYYLNLIPTEISYTLEFFCNKQNPLINIRIEILKNFIDIEDTRADLAGSLKTIQINKFFRFAERRGIGSLVIAEGSVAVDLRLVDDLTPIFDENTKIYELKSIGSTFIPYSENNFLVTLDGVAQEPGKAFTIINERKLQELDLSTSGSGPVEFDSWYISNTTVNLNNPSATINELADIQRLYDDDYFVYVKTDGIPSYDVNLGPYDYDISAQNYIKRIRKIPYSPVQKEQSPTGIIGILSNGTQIVNSKTNLSYENIGYWNYNAGNYQTDAYNGDVDVSGSYYHVSNPYALRRQLGDNISSVDDYSENPTTHSPIIGWCYDGTPIYGPYGYDNPENALSSVVKIDSSYEKRAITTRNVLPDGTILDDNVVGPPINSVEFEVYNFISFGSSTNTLSVGQTLYQVTSDIDETIVTGVNGRVEKYDPLNRRVLLSSVNGTFSSGMWIKTQTAWAQIRTTPVIYNLGYFIEDYVYTGNGHLDKHNGRFCVTPEFPQGRYCYFATIESTTNDYVNSNNGAYPYFVGPELYHTFSEENLYRSEDLRTKIVFHNPPSKYVDPITGHTQKQKFVGRTFGFVDPQNNQQYSKKYKDISDQFDGYRTTFNLEYENGQAQYAPTDAVEINESALVFLDGVIQIIGDAYTTNENLNQITFSAPPRRFGKIINISEVSSVSNFQETEIIVGQTSGATGKIIARTPLGYEGKGVLKVEVLTRDFEHNEVIVGQTSNTSSSIKLTGTISADDRFLDAANLIEANKQLIAKESVDIMLNYTAYSSFEVPGGSQNCVDDVIDVIGAVVNNLRFGGNNYTWDAANLYATGGVLNHLVGEEEQSKLVFRWAKDLCILAMQNRLGYINVDGAGYPTNAVEDRFIDAGNLIATNRDFIANEAVERMLLDPNNSGFSIPNGSVNCIDDVKDVLDSIVFNMKNGGNSKVWDSANFYATTTNLQGEEVESIEVFNHARDICNQVIFNDTVTIQGSHGLIQTVDNTITVDPGGCANVQSAIASFFSIVTETINDSNFLSTVTRTSPKAYQITYNGQYNVITDDNIIIDGASYTASCANVESAIYTLFDIVINTIDSPLSLSSINRTEGKPYIEKGGFGQKFFAYTNGKYAKLDPFDTSIQDNTTFLLKRNGELLVPTSSLQIIVIIDGIIQEFGTSYVLNEALLEFYEPVRQNSKLVVLYWYGKDLEKILQGYNLPLYDPSFVKRNLITGDPYLYVDSGGFDTNKLIRSIQSENIPISTYLSTSDKIRIDGEDSARSIFSVSDRDLIQWETDDSKSNEYFFDASNINTSFRKVYFDDYTGQPQNSDIIEPGTKVLYKSNGNPDIPGLVDGEYYFLGYRYPERAALFYENYQSSLSSDETYALEIGTSSGIHSVVIPSDLYGIKQANIRTSDYGGITKGRGADLTARVRFDMEVSDTSLYSVDQLLFSAGETVCKVIEVKSSTIVEVQILPDRIIPDGSIVTTDLGGSDPQTVISKSNGRVVSIDPVTGSFPIGGDFDTAPVIIIRPARTDTGRFARAYSQIDRNSQLLNCIVTSTGEEYYQVPDVLVTREYDVISPAYPTVLTAGYLNFWTAKDTQISVTSIIDSQKLEVELEIFKYESVASPTDLVGKEVTINIEPKIIDDFVHDSAVEYDMTTSGIVPFVEETVSLVPVPVVSVGSLRLTPTIGLLEEGKFLTETSMSLGSLEKYSNFTLETVSDRHYSSIYKDDTLVIRYNLSPITSSIESVATLTQQYQAVDSRLYLSSVAGFNKLYVKGATYWLNEGDPIYTERSYFLKGYVDKIIDSDTWIISLERGMTLSNGDVLANQPNTIKLTEVGLTYGYIQFGNEIVQYQTINWTDSCLMGVATGLYNHQIGDEVRTARPPEN